MTKLFTRKQAREFLKFHKCGSADDIQNALIDQFKDLLQEALEEEMNNHLGYSKYDWKNKEDSNSRNGHSKKIVQSQFGKTELSIPRDTEASFEPVIVKKNERQLSQSVDDTIISLYAKGMGTRDINFHMKQIYGVDISAEMVSKITDKILPIAQEWQNRLLSPMYPILYLDGIVYDVRENGIVVKKTVYVVFGINIEGKKEILGLWIGDAESSKFWMSVLSDLKSRGVKDILIASVDGLNGFEEAIKAVYPNTEIQKCMVHQIRNSTKFVNYKDRKQFCADMKPIYTAPNEEMGLKALDRFEDIWGKKYAYAIKSWRDNWSVLSTFFKYPEEIRRIIYTTNQIESFNRRLRKVTKTKGAFTSEKSLFKLLYLIIQDVTTKWTMPIHNWGQIINQLIIYFGDRVTKHL